MHMSRGCNPTKGCLKQGVDACRRWGFHLAVCENFGKCTGLQTPFLMSRITMDV